MNRPKRLETITEIVSCGCGKAYFIFTAYRTGEYYEVKGTLSKSGTCSAAHLEGLGRLITNMINSGSNPKQVAASLSGIHCPQDSKFLKSCPAAYAYILGESINLGKGGKE